MKRCLIIFISCFLSAAAQAYDFEEYAKEMPKEIKIERELAGHKAKLAAKVKKFDKSKHKLEGIPDGPEVAKIDNQRILGGDGGFLKSEMDQLYEFDSFKISLDNKEISIDKKWYLPCMFPNLNQIALKIGDDLQSVFVFMHGSDAAGSYEVIWVFRQDGNHSRYTYSMADPVGAVLANFEPSDYEDSKDNRSILKK